MCNFSTPATVFTSTNTNVLSGVLAKPILDRWVVDEADILSSETENLLSGLFESVEKQTSAEMAVVAVKSLEGEDIGSYALSLAHNKLGKKDKDNGLLILISLDDRKYRIEVGYGLEGILNDAKVGRIAREYIIPNFQKDDYNAGILLASKEIANVITGGETSINYEENIYSESYSKEDLIMFFIFLIIFIIIMIKSKGRALIFFGGFGRGRGSSGFRGFGGGGFGGGGQGGKW